MTFSSVPDAVAARLDVFLDRVRSSGAEYGPDGERFLAVARDTLRGGKRLRARFCHAGWSIVRPPGTETDALWGVCASLEVFQSAALVHDDLIDNSDTRRGRASSHRLLEAMHRDAGWDGDAEAFGRSASVLLGDLLVAWSDDLLEDALDGHPQAAATRGEYARMRRDVTIGQLLDITEEAAWAVAAPDTLLDRALRVAALKSARYSVEQPLVLGATLAGADSAVVAALRDIGRPVGLAFQLRDDVLGVFGDPDVTGKPAGDDLREGKRTALLALARERLTERERRALDASIGDRTLSTARVASLQDLIRSTGAVERIEQLISDYADQAEHALATAGFEESAVARLRALAGAAVARSS